MACKASDTDSRSQGTKRREGEQPVAHQHQCLQLSDWQRFKPPGVRHLQLPAQTRQAHGELRHVSAVQAVYAVGADHSDLHVCALQETSGTWLLSPWTMSCISSSPVIYRQAHQNELFEVVHPCSCINQ